MTLQKMSCMVIKQLIRGLASIVLMACLLLSLAYADEIIFKDQKGAKGGTVLEIDEDSVTIRFPRESIQSIIMSPEGVSAPEKKEYLKSAPVTDPKLQERMNQIQERVKRLQENLEEEKKVSGSPTLSPSKNVGAYEQLLQEEMGSVQGVLLWRGRPLSNGRVKIVLERYTGFSVASLKRMFKGGKGKSSDEEIGLVAQTNSQGHYSFSRAPPGYYRIYWLPENETVWFHRLREKPDFEVISGNLTIQNIPEKKK